MGHLYEEIDSRPSALGEISLRRRRIPALGDRDIYEVKLGDEFLMSSMFTEAEVALADLGLQAVEGETLRVVVGGLGLGYTAQAALKDPRVGELLVVEALETVIDWHQEEKVPLGKVLNADSRCRYIRGSFFDLATGNGRSFDPTDPGAIFDAVLLDIDHSPSDYLHDANAGFYTPSSLAAMARQIRTGGVFAMWSNAPPDADFLAMLGKVFDNPVGHRVSFYNPFQNAEAVNSVYVAVKRY